MNLRLQNIMGDFGNPTNYGINSSQPPSPTFQGQGPMNPMENAQPPLDYSPTPPEMQTQNSVFASREQGKEHPAVTDGWLRLKSIVDSMYTPETRATKRYNDLLDNAPEINTPSLGRKFVAAGAALGNVGPHFTRTGGGIEAADRVKYAPYLNEMADFKEKAGLFAPAAQQENTSNANERILAGNMATALNADEKNRITEKNNDEKNRIAQERAAIAQAHQNGTTFVRVGDDLFGTRADGTSYRAGTATNFNDQELETLKQKGRMEVTNAEQTGANQRAQMNNGTVVGSDGRTYRVDPATNTWMPMGGLPPGAPMKIGTESKPNSAENDRQIQDRLEAIYLQNNKGINDKIIIKNPAGKYEMTPKPQLGEGKSLTDWTGATEKDQATWDAVHAIAYGTSSNIQSQQGQSQPQGQNQPTMSVPPVVQGPLVINPNKPSELHNPDDLAKGTRKQQIQKELQNPNLSLSQAGALQDELNKLNSPFRSSQDYDTRRNPQNPNEWKRTKDGGMTFEYSHNGGQTWGMQ